MHEHPQSTNRSILEANIEVTKRGCRKRCIKRNQIINLRQKTIQLSTLLTTITQFTRSKSNFHYPAADGEKEARRANDRRVCSARSMQKGNNIRVGESSSEVTADPIVATATAYRHARQVSTRSFLQRLPINIVDDGSKRVIPAVSLTIYDHGHAHFPIAREIAERHGGGIKDEKKNGVIRLMGDIGDQIFCISHDIRFR